MPVLESNTKVFSQCLWTLTHPPQWFVLAELVFSTEIFFAQGKFITTIKKDGT